MAEAMKKVVKQKKVVSIDSKTSPTKVWKLKEIHVLVTQPDSNQLEEFGEIENDRKEDDNDQVVGEVVRGYPAAVLELTYELKWRHPDQGKNRQLIEIWYTLYENWILYLKPDISFESHDAGAKVGRHHSHMRDGYESRDDWEN